MHKKPTGCQLSYCIWPKHKKWTNNKLKQNTISQWVGIKNNLWWRRKCCAFNKTVYVKQLQ